MAPASAAASAPTQSLSGSLAPTRGVANVMLRAIPRCVSDVLTCGGGSERSGDARHHLARNARLFERGDLFLRASEQHAGRRP